MGIQQHTTLLLQVVYTSLLAGGNGLRKSSYRGGDENLQKHDRANQQLRSSISCAGDRVITENFGHLGVVDLGGGRDQSSLAARAEVT